MSDKKSYIRAEELEVGDSIRLLEGHPMTIEEIQPPTEYREWYEFIGRDDFGLVSVPGMPGRLMAADKKTE